MIIVGTPGRKEQPLHREGDASSAGEINKVMKTKNRKRNKNGKMREENLEMSEILLIFVLAIAFGK